MLQCCHICCKPGADAGTACKKEIHHNSTALYVVKVYSITKLIYTSYILHPVPYRIVYDLALINITCYAVRQVMPRNSRISFTCKFYKHITQHRDEYCGTYGEECFPVH